MQWLIFYLGTFHSCHRLTWPQRYKTFFMLNSTFISVNQQCQPFILLINVKMPTTVGILTFMSKNANIYEQDKFHAQLS